MSKITVHLTPKQAETLANIDSKDNHLQKAIDTAQNFVDQNEWKQGFSVFAMRGYYNHETQKTRVLFLMINNTQETISSFSAQLHPVAKNNSVADFSVANVVLAEDYLGQVDPQNAILFFVDIPTRALSQDTAFEFDDLALQMYSILVN